MTTPDIARGIHRGQTLAALVERTPVRAPIEGVGSGKTGNLYTINALVPNPTPRVARRQQGDAHDTDGSASRVRRAVSRDHARGRSDRVTIGPRRATTSDGCNSAAR